MATFDLTLLTRQIDSLRYRLDAAQQDTNQLPTESSARTNLDVWSNTIDELSACQEALSQQQDEIIIALRAVKEERQRYQNFFNFAPDAYVITDTAGGVRQANRAAATLLGRSQERLIGKSLILFVAQKGRRQFRAQLNHFLKERQRRQWEVQLQPSARAAFPASITVIFIPDDATSSGSVLWLIHDISAQKWAEEEMRKASHKLAQQVADRTAQLVKANEALQAEITARQDAQTQVIENERLAVLGVTAEKVAHEIGNALNNLSTTVQLQRYHLNPRPALHDATLMMTVHDLQQQLRRLNEIVHGWRSLAHQSRLQVESTNLSVLIAEELDSLARRCADQGVRVVWDLPEDLPQMEVDHEKLRRALCNVCVNALNAMPNGGTLTVHASQAEEYVCIEIGDTGPSLPAGLDLFKLFTTALPPRVGLGLVIAEQIINAHGGRMTYDSGPGVGNIIRLRLPVER